MEDGNFWHLGGVTRWNSHFFIHTWTFLTIIYVASQLFLCLFWISLWLKNRCLQHPYFKNLCKIAQASKNSNSKAQHFLSDLLTHSWFHSMLFALPGYHSLILSWIGVSTLVLYCTSTVVLAAWASWCLWKARGNSLTTHESPLVHSIWQPWGSEFMFHIFKSWLDTRISFKCFIYVWSKSFEMHRAQFNRGLRKGWDSLCTAQIRQVDSAKTITLSI
jgi:hypothetical protein